ncbi:uncharacterized protein JN550_007383 [Neoarthrinium moseri]|uniref:uncharacterized protein n=1 Tax=Neoarthrinium moseri TaxID=1658444 RepID=UPI001FDD9E6C|nr:uncharacterized protein JN550_007383 [Neoarthrinium moseri]KAI1866836.1 hypothetical protein JN550_007383 [Neoarthrinium moseri]
MQGFNMGRYVPPDVEGTTSGNRLHKKHALGGRASKLASQGVLTVRFEMPFAVWCGTCPKPTIIGQGVRFNAEKKRVGAYHSTPIFSFRMRHAECGGALEIRTDPQNTAYVVTEGGRRREDRGTGDDDESEGAGRQPPILTDKEREALRGNAFAKLEKTIEDREQLVAAKARIEEIHDANSRTWEDPYDLNRRLRREFRVGRHQREKEGKETEELRDRMSLGIDLVPGTEEDARRAKLVDFGSLDGREVGDKALAKPLFERKTSKLPTPVPNGNKRLKSEIAASQMRESLVSEIVGNTRATQDPFLITGRAATTAKTPVRMPGIKRKRDEQEGGAALEDTSKEGQSNGATGTASMALVGYSSDSESS